MNGEDRIGFYARLVEWQTAGLVARQMPARDEVGVVPQGIGDIRAAHQPHIHHAVIQMGVGREQSQTAQVAADVGCDREQEMTVHLLLVGPDAQVHPMPDGGIPERRGNILRDRNVLKESGAGFELTDRDGVQTDPGPQQKGTPIAHSHIHRVEGGCGEQPGILPQRAHMQPVERWLTKFHRPHVHGAGREDSQCGIGMDQAAGYLTDRTISTNDEDRVILLSRSLLCDLCSPPAVQKLLP